MPGPNKPSRLTLTLLPAALVAATAAAAGTGHRNAATAEQKPGSMHLPLVFEANKGQTAEPVRFLSRGNGYTLFLTPTEAVMKFQHAAPKKFEGHLDWRPEWAKAQAGDVLPRSTAGVLRMQLVGSNPRPQVRGVQPLAGTASYFTGRDAGQWRSGVPTYAQVRYQDVYPGVDMLYYGNERHLEYDFVVAPGADPSRIGLRVGAHPRVMKDGGLAVTVDGGDVYLQKPTVYQQKAGKRELVAANFDVRRNGQVGFHLGAYDRTRPLVIDPVVLYSTLLGGSGFDSAQGITMDPAGNVYLTGYTESVTFPTAGALQSTNRGNGDAFIAKLSADGSKLLACTYFGGTGQDSGTGIGLDGAGNIYVCGTTDSTDFPVKSALQPTLSGGTDAFLLCIDHASGQVSYATYLGGTGSDGASRMAVAADGTAYVTGFTSSADFPVTESAAQPTFGGEYDGFVTGVAPGGQSTTFSTYVGGSGPDSGNGVAIGPDGNITVGGTTDSPDFVTTGDALQGGFQGGRFGDSFLVRYNPDGTLVYSTLWGGSGSDACAGVAVDEAGWTYLALNTTSTDIIFTEFMATPLQPAIGAGAEGYVLKFWPGFIVPENQLGPDSGGNKPQWLRYYTYFGGNGDDVIRAIGVDGALKLADATSVSKCYLLGETDSTDLTTRDPIQPVLRGQADLFLTKFHEDLMLATPDVVLDYSSYLGGEFLEHGSDMFVDKVGNVAIAGNTESPDYPQHRALPAPKKQKAGVNGLVMKMWTGVPQPGGILQVTPQITFPTVKTGKFLMHPVVVKNLSRTTPLSIKIGIPAAPFSFQSGLLAVQLAPGQQVSYPLYFQPNGAGVVSDLIMVQSSDPNRPIVNVRVQGRGK